MVLLVLLVVGSLLILVWGLLIVIGLVKGGLVDVIGKGGWGSSGALVVIVRFILRVRIEHFRHWFVVMFRVVR